MIDFNIDWVSDCNESDKENESDVKKDGKEE